MSVGSGSPASQARLASYAIPPQSPPYTRPKPTPASVTGARNIQLIPYAAAAAGKYFDPATSRYNSPTDRRIGLDGKVVIRDAAALDVAINPDFSQVESDAFQVEVNQRFPVFFDEKRPFFMEGLGLFTVAGTTGDGNMRTAVHTRRIVDPIAGAKLTGTAGRQTFGAPFFFWR